MSRLWSRSFIVLAAVALAARADAATFSIAIKNTTSYNWSTGLITTAPTIAIGNTPTSGSGYYVYGYGNSSCNPVSGDDGNSTLLAQDLGLTVGTNAWIVPAINQGATTTVSITVPQGASMSYISAIYGTTASGAEADDDIIMMHTPGQTSTLAVPLFDADGLPLANPSWELSGYDLNSTSATNGNGNSCTPKCPVSGSSCFVAPDNGTTGATLPTQPVAPGFTPMTPYTQSGYTTDAIALGDVTGDGVNDLVVVLENGQYNATFNQSARGRAIVLSRALTSVASFDATTVGHDFMGFPTIENLSGGTSGSQFVVQEFSPIVTGTQASSGLVYGRSVSGSATSQYFTLSNFSYPGFWNMGSSAADVRTDVGSGVNELVVPSWNGEINVFAERTTTPSTLNTYNMVTAWNEQVYGPVAIANVTGTSANEIIAFGSTTGRVVALDPNTSGTGMTVAWKSVPPTGANAIYAFGSGPAVGDLDGDGKPEIVVASAGHGYVYAYDPTDSSGNCKYRWLNTGGFDYTWSSPVIGDVNGDGVKDVVVFSSDSVLTVLDKPSGTGTGCRDGAVVWTYKVGNGGPAWFTPALAKLSPVKNKVGYDIVVANYNTLEVVDATNKTVGYRYTAKDAQFFPSAVVDTSGTVPSVFASGWADGKVYRFDAPTGTPTGGTSWPSFMGGNTRTGAR